MNDKNKKDIEEYEQIIKTKKQDEGGGCGGLHRLLCTRPYRLLGRYDR